MAKMSINSVSVKVMGIRKLFSNIVKSIGKKRMFLFKVKTSGVKTMAKKKKAKAK